jgi:putative toxin-antitoxin system antitoxin component (TIGR02293 family)
LAALRKHGLEVFENETAFNHWLKSSLPSLEGNRPIDYLDTSYGFELINQLLGRIEHGVFA